MQGSRCLSGPRGFTLVEALVGAALLMIVIVGTLPLFTRSMINNTAGADSSQVSNMVKAKAEELFQQPFNHPDLAIGETVEYWSEPDREWIELGDGEDPPRDARWLRTTVVRQYGIGDLAADERFDDPLPASTGAGAVHVKEIQVTAESRAAGPLGGRRRITARLFKPF